MKDKAVLIFGEQLPCGWQRSLNQHTAVITHKKLEQEVKEQGYEWINLEGLIEPGSIYEASAFLEELSFLTLPDGSRLAKTFMYEGYELWWMHLDNLFLYYCLPYTQYKNLLDYLTRYRSVQMYRPPYKNLFYWYLQSHGSTMTLLQEPDLKRPTPFPFGVLLQILLSLISLPILIARRYHLMVFTGDKFDKNSDYDFRMRFIYEELRRKGIPFVEFIRSLESWKVVLAHAFTRKRPVIYSEAVAFIGRFVSILSGGRARAKREFGVHAFNSETSPETQFKILVASHYLLTVYDDIWAIRIMKMILRIIGVRAAFIPAATERNFHAVLGCKLNAIPTVGILHGVSSRYYNLYDFMPGFDGKKMLSVDIYGLWSEWWKEYYARNSKAYTLEQLYVSGPMRPLQNTHLHTYTVPSKGAPIKVLLVSEQVAVPAEALPYLRVLLEMKGVSIYVTFRPYRDEFEEWLKKNHSDILERIGEDHIIRSGIHNAITQCDVVVGSYSTAVLEALLELKPPIFYKTKKWGDYFDLKNFDSRHVFFVENPEELIECIRKSREIPMDILKKLQEKFFGDPHQNGSKWVVQQLEKFL